LLKQRERRCSITHPRRIDGIECAPQNGVVHYDRDTYSVDVMENVFRGIQVLSDTTQGFSGDVVDLDVRAWLAGTAISAVYFRVLKPDDR
jgi:hypothetical protein